MSSGQKQSRNCDEDSDADGVKPMLGHLLMCVTDLPSMCQWLKPCQGARSLNLRFNLHEKNCIHADNAGHLPELPHTVASGKGCWSWVCKAVIACGTVGLGVSDGGKIF